MMSRFVTKILVFILCTLYFYDPYIPAIGHLFSAVCIVIHIKRLGRKKVLLSVSQTAHVVELTTVSVRAQVRLTKLSENLAAATRYNTYTSQTREIANLTRFVHSIGRTCNIVAVLE